MKPFLPMQNAYARVITFTLIMELASNKLHKYLVSGIRDNVRQEAHHALCTDLTKLGLICSLLNEFSEMTHQNTFIRE